MLQVMINGIVLMLTLGLCFGSIVWKVFAKKPSSATRAFIASIIAPIGLILFFTMVAYLTLKQ